MRAACACDSWRTTYRGMIPDAYLDGDEGRGEHRALGPRARPPAPNRPRVFVAASTRTASSVSPRATGLPSRSTASTPSSTAVYLASRVPARRARPARSSAPSSRRSARRRDRPHHLGDRRQQARARVLRRARRRAAVVEQPFQWDGMDLVEAGYGWRDLVRARRRLRRPRCRKSQSEHYLESTQ